MYERYIACLNELAPFIEVKNVPEVEAWMTCELIVLIRMRDKLKHEADNFDKCDVQGKIAKVQEFNKQQKLVKREIIKAKRDFTKGKIQNCEDNPRKYWAELNRVLPTGKIKKGSVSETIRLKK